MRGRRTAALLCGLLLVAAGAVAQAEVVQKGTLRVSFSGGLSPSALPRDEAAPISVAIGGRISTTDGSPPPQLRKIAIAINREGRLNHAGLPFCRLDEIEPSTTEKALAACRDALVGEGEMSANVDLPQQAPFPSKGKILAFNGKLKGRPVLLAHVYGTDPVPTSFTLPFRIRGSAGTFGTVLEASLPRVTANWGFVTALNLDLGRRFHSGGRSHGYLNGSCPAPKGFRGAVFPLVRASFFFSNRTMKADLVRSCKVRG